MPIGAARLNTLSRRFAPLIFRPKTVTAQGSAVVSTAQNRFGGASASFTGANGTYLTVTPSSDFARGTGNFTLEYWVRPTNLNSCVHFDTRPAGNSNATAITMFYSGSALTYYSGGAVRITGVALSTGVWTHIALTRSGNDHRLYINGTQRGSTYTASQDINTVSSAISIGANSDGPGTLALNGFIDEIRFSNNVRYTANFTSPTAAFTNDANTILLLHCNGTNGSTSFPDDNA